jgi:2-phospho-L-lactate/phosphoenolpyruvate guanylyltransferase
VSKDWAVIPVKGLNESKTRLSSFLGPKRRLFIEALLHDVLSSVVDSNLFDTILLVSSDEALAAEARKQNVPFLRQTLPGLNRAVDEANKHALQDHASSVAIVLGDIPLVKPEDFNELMHINSGRQKVVMAPSMKGGTNVMLSSPPGVIEPSYGRWSYSKHLRRAQSLGVNSYSMSNPRISFDIDTPDDLKELGRRDPNGKTESSRVLQNLIAPLNAVRVH